MRIAFLIYVFALSSLQAHGFKFLVYNPLVARSHVNFMSKLANVLAEAGHDVVMLSPIIDATITDIGAEKVITIPPCASSILFTEIASDVASSNLWRTQSLSGVLQQSSTVLNAWFDQCNATINHPGLLESLKNEKFDAAITEYMDMCGLGIFRHLGIEKFAVAFSLAAIEGSFDMTGLPSFPSYVPGAMMSYGEKMTFLERVVNTLSLGIGKVFFPYICRGSEQIFRANFGPDFPGLNELASAASLFFVNAEPLIEFPRPIVHKIVDIGGISVSAGHKELNETWSGILDLRPQTVVLSFGTVAKSHLMPDNYKRTIREVIKKFPQVTFIWKYEKPDDRISDGISNLIETTWVPQNDMLYDRRLSLFITHCGQGSTTEATTAGVPLIVIPISGDQTRNAAVINRIGTGVALEKEALASTELLESALREALGSEKYRDKAREVGELIRNRPFAPREMFVRNMEFLARFGPLSMLDHYGKELGFVQYYLLDVFAFLTCILCLALFVSFKCATITIRCCFLSRKLKRD